MHVDLLDAKTTWNNETGFLRVPFNGAIIVCALRLKGSQWYWLGGSKTSNVPVSNTGDWPGDRVSAALWQSSQQPTDATFDVIMFSGFGPNTTNPNDYIVVEDTWVISISVDIMKAPVAKLLPYDVAGPPARIAANAWSYPGTGNLSNVHWLFGGWNSSNSFWSGVSYADLWSFTYDSHKSTIKWHQYVPGKEQQWSEPRHGAASWVVPKGKDGLRAYIFGGATFNQSKLAMRNDLWRLDMISQKGGSEWTVEWKQLQALQAQSRFQTPGVLLGIPTPSWQPQARMYSSAWVTVAE